MTTNPHRSAFSPFGHIVAFEVSKDTLVVHTTPADEQRTIDNRPLPVRRLIRAEIKRNQKERLGQMLVICEATGGYERHVLDVALEMGVAVHRAHGARVRHFGRYRGLLAKTDPIDARLLVQYGLMTENIRLYTPPPPETVALRALHARRTEIQQMIIAETGRLDHARHKGVLKSLKAHIAALEAAFAVIEAEIAQLVEESDTLRKKVALMRTVIGIGPISAMILLAHLPDIGGSPKAKSHGWQDWRRSTMTAARSAGHATSKRAVQQFDERSIWQPELP